MKIVANIIGALGAILFVGYFAYKVNELPLSIIVIFCLSLMVYSFFDDAKKDRAVALALRENGQSQ